jgi:uncharacterized protein (DUF2141 family)
MNRLTTAIAATALIASGISLSAPMHSAYAAPASVGSLDLSLVDIAAPKGRIMVAVYASQADYDGDKPARGMAIEVSGATATTQFAGLTPGRYAIKLFHDVNGNGKMDTNPFGMPVEPYAFSNSAKGHMGPAKWDAAAFDVQAGANSHTISFK